MRGNDQAVVLLDEWVPHPRRLDRDEALGEFVRRYFTSHGPATLRDFTWWTKLTVRDTTIGMALARDHLEELVVDDVSYWMAPGLPDRASRRVHALPGFDEFLLGYQDRSASLAAEHAPVIVPGNNGMFQSTIVIGGRVAGLAAQENRGRRHRHSTAVRSALGPTAVRVRGRRRRLRSLPGRPGRCRGANRWPATGSAFSTVGDRRDGLCLGHPSSVSADQERKASPGTNGRLRSASGIRRTPDLRCSRPARHRDARSWPRTLRPAPI